MKTRLKVGIWYLKMEKIKGCKGRKKNRVCCENEADTMAHVSYIYTSFILYYTEIEELKVCCKLV